MKTLGDKIKILRTRRKILQVDLAKMAMITPEYLSGIETNKRKNLTIETLKRLAEALKVEPYDLLR